MRHIPCNAYRRIASLSAEAGCLPGGMRISSPITSLLSRSANPLAEQLLWDRGHAFFVVSFAFAVGRHPSFFLFLLISGPSSHAGPGRRTRTMCFVFTLCDVTSSLLPKHNIGTGFWGKCLLPQPTPFDDITPSEVPKRTVAPSFPFFEPARILHHYIYLLRNRVDPRNSVSATTSAT